MHSRIETGNRNSQDYFQAPFGQLFDYFEMFKMFSDFHIVELGVATWPENHNYNYTSHYDPRFDLCCLLNK